MYESLFRHASHCLNILKTETDISPQNPVINETLGSFVHQVCASCPLNDGNCQGCPFKETMELRCYLAKAECEMERYYAREFTSRPFLTVDDLASDFIYWENYDVLASKEIELLEKSKKLSLIEEKKNIAFVGSGPLPLTAIIFVQKTGCRISCIDNDPIACELSGKLIDTLGLEDYITVHHTGGEGFDYSRFPIVFIASLVSVKNKVIEQIHKTRKNHVSYIAVRSAEDFNTLLYEPFCEKDFGCLPYQMVGKTQYCAKTINTTLGYYLEAA